MLRCASCGALCLDGSTRCGLCGNATLGPRDRVAIPVQSTQHRPVRDGRLNLIVALTIGIVSVFVGLVLVALPIDLVSGFVGLLLIMIGGITLLATTGVFSGTPYKGRLLNRADRRLRERERRKYSD